MISGISEEMNLAYLDLIRIFTDPQTSSAHEWRLVDQLTEAYKDHEAFGDIDSYEELFYNVESLQDYIDYRNSIYEVSSYMLACDNYDINVEPISMHEILAALDEHPSSGSEELCFFDAIVHSAFMADNYDDEKWKQLRQEAVDAAYVHLGAISGFGSGALMVEKATDIIEESYKEKEEKDNENENEDASLSELLSPVPQIQGTICEPDRLSCTNDLSTISPTSVVQFLSPVSVNMLKNNPPSNLPPVQALLSSALLLAEDFDPIELYFEEESKDEEEEFDPSLFEISSPGFQIQDSNYEPEEKLNDKMIVLPVKEEANQKTETTVEALPVVRKDINWDRSLIISASVGIEPSEVPIPLDFNPAYTQLWEDLNQEDSGQFDWDLSSDLPHAYQNHEDLGCPESLFLFILHIKT